jgi:hypothetical protein
MARTGAIRCLLAAVLFGVSALTFFALRPDSEVDTPHHQQVIEHGSPTALDQAASS